MYCLHHSYQHHAMPPVILYMVAANFLLGLVVYSAIVRAEYPAIGSNFAPPILAVALILWISRRLKCCDCRKWMTIKLLIPASPRATSWLGEDAQASPMNISRLAHQQHAAFHMLGVGKLVKKR